MTDKNSSLNDLLKNYNLSPQQIAIIAAILFDALYVKSILIDREQTVIVLLEGSLKTRNEQTEKLLNEIKDINIRDLMDFLSSRK